LKGGEGDEDPMVTPEVPRGGPVRQPIFHDQAHSDSNDPVRIMASGEGQIGRVGVEIMVAVGAVMLRIDEVDIVGAPGLQITQVV
jgi:hypothetical protein